MDKRVVASEGSKVYHPVQGEIETEIPEITVGCGRIFSKSDVRVFKSWQSACGLGLTKCKRSGCTGKTKDDEEKGEQGDD